MQIWLIFRDSSYDNSALFGLAIKWPLTFEDDFEFVHLKIDFANSGWWSRLNSFRCWMVLSLFLPNNSMYFCHVKCGLTSLRYILWHFCQEGLGRIIWMYINYYSSAILVPFWFCLYLDFGVTFFFKLKYEFHEVSFPFPTKKTYKNTTSNPQGFGCLWSFSLGKWEEWTRLNTQLAARSWELFISHTMRM